MKAGIEQYFAAYIVNGETRPGRGIRSQVNVFLTDFFKINLISKEIHRVEHEYINKLMHSSIDATFYSALSDL